MELKRYIPLMLTCFVGGMFVYLLENHKGTLANASALVGGLAVGFLVQSRAYWKRRAQKAEQAGNHPDHTLGKFVASIWPRKNKAVN